MADEPETGSTRITPSNASVADADITNPMFVCLMLDRLRKAGAEQEIEDLLARDPAGHADLNWPGNVACLLLDLQQLGADQQIARLLARDPAGSADISDAGAAAFLLNCLRQVGAGQQVAAFLARDPAGHCELDDDDDEGGGVVTLAWSLHSAGADDQVTVLLTRLSAAGEWSLLDEIHEATGLPVPQKD